ncbi:uncharacterized protein LOC121422150 isoform X2 [Lytechinus variegatus]|uniref:uncharacterized protein LOC121422150 isoform X2 n=1 Tax=Lytechinus variegatus TaxID=7654 RepID=UPI001BB0E5AB|nr:uncharacterized protein LOC121422150 isoform X2 [Lytechinus variegatus]
MDDISLMDTTSDDELDFNTPLWKRINRRQVSSSGSPRDGKDLLFAKPFFEEAHDKLKKGLTTSGSSDGTAFGERGSPLSEVTSNISWGPLSPTFPGKPTLDKGNPFARSADCKTSGPGTSKAECFRTPYQEESTKYPVSEKGKLGKTKLTSTDTASERLQAPSHQVSKEPQSYICGKFAKDEPDTSGRQHLPLETSSTLSPSPSKGGWKKIHVSPTETSKKLLNLPISPWRHVGKVSPKHASPGSSVHIHWDKNKKMQSTSLEPKGSSRYSPNKLRTHFSPSSTLRSPSTFSIRSPILIPDTPNLESQDRKQDSDDGNIRSSSPKSQLGHSGNRDRPNVLLNDLLSEDDDFKLDQDLPSTSSARSLFSSRSPRSSHDVISPKKTVHTPTKKVKEIWMQKLKGSESSERKEARQRDPVWDFADKFSSPEKYSDDSSKTFDHRRQGVGVNSKEDNYFNKVISPEKKVSRKYLRSVTTSEDDDLPLISYVTKKNRQSACDKSPADSAKHMHDPLVTSPSRTWTSPPNRSSWASPTHSKKLPVISPWRPQSGVSSGVSHRKDTLNNDAQTAKGISSSSSIGRANDDKKDGMAHRRSATGNDDRGKRNAKGKFASAMTKKKLMASLFADFSSDEDEDNHLSADKKRKNEDGAHGLESVEERTKRRKVNSHSTCEDFDGSSNSRDQRRVGHRTSSKRITDGNHLSDSIQSSSTTISPSYPNQKSVSRTSSKKNPIPSTKTSGQSSSDELAQSRYSKGRGEKTEKGQNGPSRKEGRQITSSRFHTSDPLDLPSSSGISEGTVNTVKDDSDDEVVVLDSYAYASSLVGTYGKTRKSHKKNAAHDKKKDARGSSKSSSRSSATGSLADERNTVSPSLLRQLNQMESDEAMARRLQEEYDAEMARSVQQHRPTNKSREDTHRAESTATHSASDRREAVNEPDAGTFANFNPRHNISIEVSSDVPVQIGSFNWNYDFQPASSLLDLGRPDRPPPSHSPPPLPRRGRPDHRQRRGSRSRNSDARVDEGIPNLANINPPPRPGRQRVRGGGRARGRRRVMGGDHNNGNDYDALLQLAENLGPAVDKRLNQASIDRLPTFKFAKDQHSGSQEENSCPICMDDYEEGAELRRLPCFHGYHKNCIDMWLKKNQDPVCPICRVEVKIE